LDVRHVRPHLGVDGDCAAFVDLDARGVGPDEVAVGAPSDGHQHPVEVLGSRGVWALERDPERAFARLDVRDLRTE
jgi:hypothetical protein